ncbi:efflux RND transporter periplasmic adaptor subunit [Cylindrospermopsis raciborskii]|uniref:efflux RND transporter periplasmic adaptor subunit n=1 Tax=Cylindrospermopsis raciborskii TaxID=77022 RepID=UPI000E1F8C8E|nr:efflux RND transporter periplasmic adaptor subunit [Cylindrospermopsis raciborskii]UJL35227.1 efflux RND transporter periplasmic adaptor subunit [Cylindrospermopsis raciborskii Cr2010]
MVGDLESKPNPQVLRSLVILGTAIIMGVGGLQLYKILLTQHSKANQTPTSESTIPPIHTVTALGRLEPRGKVIKLSASTLTQGSRVERLLVKEGDMVKVGQIIAILDNKPRLQAAYEEAEAIDNTSRKQIEEAKTALNRIRSTGGEQIISAKAILNKIAEVRPIDIAAARAELNRAKAAAQQAKVNLDQAYIKSPQKGVVFEIHTRAGELVGNEGIVEIGETSQMYAVAEVYQSDISKILPQQQVKISSSSLEGELQGSVERIGWEVKRQNVINSDPSENIDARVVEVYIRPVGK